MARHARPRRGVGVGEGSPGTRSVRRGTGGPAGSPATLLPIGIAISLCAFGSAVAHASAEGAGAAGRAYLDLLDMHGNPASSTDRSFNVFFDSGAWQGYSLPPEDNEGTGFIGPFVHSWGEGRWAGRGFAQLSLRCAAGGSIALRAVSGHSAPGYLVRNFTAPGLKVSETLFFADSWSALVRIRLTSDRRQSIDVSVRGRLMRGQSKGLTVRGTAVVQTLAGSRWKLVTRLHGANATAVITHSGDDYRISSRRPLPLQPHQSAVIYLVQTLLDGTPGVRRPPVTPATAWTRNRERWSRYLRAASAAQLAGLPEATARRVTVKAMETLLGNWRAPREGLRHAGVIPSYSNPDFNGFWAWDSWKHAAALASFDPGLARSQMLAMFDYQAPDGMIPDCIFLHPADDNWRDSKPPLATWAALKIYGATGDKSFLAKLYPKLVRYHDWWLEERDHAHDGLVEYGSTDGTTLAAKWESGMDNAVRFDDVRMLRNGRGAWSMNQEAVDLNAYLYRDTVDLARVARVLGKVHDQSRWQQRAAALKARIESRFFDDRLGYFFDVTLPGGRFVTTYGPEGWIPLWAGAASQRQAISVAHVVRNPRKFATYMPFPSLAADDPRFSPVTGYWRGPVWLDQAYFGVEGLKRYGHRRLADRMALRLILHAKGLTGNAPIYENYDPLSGAGYQSRNFSWSAASYLLLLLGKREHAARGLSHR
jgi:putative isomerase